MNEGGEEGGSDGDGGDGSAIWDDGSVVLCYVCCVVRWMGGVLIVSCWLG